MSELLLILFFLSFIVILPLLACVFIIVIYSLVTLSSRLKQLEEANNQSVDAISSLMNQVSELKKDATTYTNAEIIDDCKIKPVVSQENEDKCHVKQDDIDIKPIEAKVEQVSDEIIDMTVQNDKIEDAPPEEERKKKIKSAKEKEGFLLKDNLEAYIGGRLLNRIGALALIIGIAFFLKYAFDQNWISETIRVLIGAILGGGLLYGGWLFFKKEFTVFSQGLIGAGIGTLYLTFYAAYNFYELIPYPIAVLLMAIVTFLALAQALYYNSLAIAILGLLGGFLTPFILTTDMPSAVGLFVYLVFINIAVIVLLIKKDSWRALEISSIVATFCIYIAWSTSAVSRQEFLVTALFLTLIWLMYYSLSLSRIVKDDNKYPFITNITNLILLFFYYINMLELVDFYFHKYWGIVSFTLVIVYFSTAFLVKYQYKNQNKVLAQYVIPAILLLVIAIEQQYSGYLTVILYSFEALALVILGINWKRNYIWLISYLIYALALIKLAYLFFANPIEICEFVAIFNEQAATFLVLCGTMGLTALLLEQNILVNYKNIAMGFIRTAWMVLTFIFIGIEISFYFDKLVYIATKDFTTIFKYAKPIFLSLIWVLYSMQLIKYGLSKKYLSYKILGTTMFTIAVLLGITVGSSFIPLNHYLPVWNIRFGLFIIIVISLITIGRWVEKYFVYENKELKDLLIPFIRYSWAVVLFIMFTVEANDYFNSLLITTTGQTTELIGFYKPLILSIIWTFCALGSIQQGLAKDQIGYIYIGFVMLFLALLSSVVIGCYFHPIAYYIPIANLRFVAVGVVITAIILVITWLRKTGDYYVWNKNTITVLRVLASFFIILLLTYESLDVFNKELNFIYTSNSSIIDNGGVIDAANSTLTSFYLNLKQLALSVLWLVYSVSLMIYGIAKRIKVLRVTAICFFSIAILKIFCYDLSFLETLYRIFSFMGLGVISLGISYLYQRYKDLIIADDN